MTLNIGSVVALSTNTFLKTLWKHYAIPGRKKKNAALAQLRYDAGIALITKILLYAGQNKIEELQSLTSGNVSPHRSYQVQYTVIGDKCIDAAADILVEYLGNDMIQMIGGANWWRFRVKELQAEWVQTKERFKREKVGAIKNQRVLFYLHGGAYFFNSVDAERYQIQRHAKKMDAVAFAPKYRLAPQYPFPCAIHDALSSYLHLLYIEKIDPSCIIFMGGSAGGGLAISLLCILRDMGIPMPAAAVLISPWADLTHSFDSITGDASGDYIPSEGFHHRPSAAWPPPTQDELESIRQELKTEQKVEDEGETESGEESGSVKDTVGQGNKASYLQVDIDGETVELKDQIHMYVKNDLLDYPLVSPATQPSLGGLPPLLVTVGGSELLRDEGIYLAHKAANPEKYPTSTHVYEKYNIDPKQGTQYPPTDVFLQDFDNCCHVVTTIAFSRPAKYMFRSVANFGIWAFEKSSKTESNSEGGSSQVVYKNYILVNGKVPEFKDHMIRQRVSVNGFTRDLESVESIPCLNKDPSMVASLRKGPAERWLKRRAELNKQFESEGKMFKRIIAKEYVRGESSGFVGGKYKGENPPLCAIVASKTMAGAIEKQKHWGRGHSKPASSSIWASLMTKDDDSTKGSMEDSDIGDFPKFKRLMN